MTINLEEASAILSWHLLDGETETNLVTQPKFEPGTFRNLLYQCARYTHLRVLVIANVAAEGTPALGVDLQ